MKTILNENFLIFFWKYVNLSLYIYMCVKKENEYKLTNRNVFNYV